MKSHLLKLLLVLAMPASAMAEPSAWDKPSPPIANTKEVTVYRSPTCGCCEKWIAHMEKQGFTVKDHPTEDMASIKAKLGIPDYLGSCHTAVAGGYLFEGHVPANDIKKLLTQKSANAAGLSVPGMPVGTPGMEMGKKKDKFSVILFDKQGNADQFNQYEKY